MNGKMPNLEAPHLMEPMLPSEDQSQKLEDLAVDLIGKAGRFEGSLPKGMERRLGELVRSMNCYYSNLIENHNTHPLDIDRALRENYSTEPKKRNLQLEARAHIEVQKLIDEGKGPLSHTDLISWIHKEFCERLPEDLLWIEDPKTEERFRVHPGEYRERMVEVGNHVGPKPENLPGFLKRFEEAFSFSDLKKVRQIIAVAASHHRLLGIHPFLDGNGRVARLFSHALLLRLGVGNRLWSISRGLGRNVDVYRGMLDAADRKRESDSDGRGSRSEKGLVAFCDFFLRACIDQVEFMHSLIDPNTLLARISIWTEEEVRAGRLPKKSFSLLREALRFGEIRREDIGRITGYTNRHARGILNKLIQKKLLHSETPRARNVSISFPIEVVGRWFPRLFPDIT